MTQTYPLFDVTSNLVIGQITTCNSCFKTLKGLNESQSEQLTFVHQILLRINLLASYEVFRLIR